MTLPAARPHYRPQPALTRHLPDEAFLPRFAKNKGVPRRRNARSENHDVELVSTSAVIPSAAATTTAETSTGSFFTGTGFVDSQRPTIQLCAVALTNRLGSFFLRAHLHEGEPFGLTGELVHDELAIDDITRLFEQVENVPFRGVEG